MGKIPAAYWDRLTAYLEAKFPETEEDKKTKTGGLPTAKDEVILEPEKTCKDDA